MSGRMQLILASASPRRRELLSSMGVEFDVHSPQVDESRRDNELPEDYVVRIAKTKALAAADALGDSVAILAADTVVVQARSVYGKPNDLAHAKQIWHALSSAQHQVLTAVCLYVEGRQQIRVSTTDVAFASISDDQMERYWATGEPADKAGAYAIQGLASAWVKLINGSYSNVVGLPLREVNQLLTSIDHNWL